MPVRKEDWVLGTTHLKAMSKIIKLALWILRDLLMAIWITLPRRNRCLWSWMRKVSRRLIGMYRMTQLTVCLYIKKETKLKKIICDKEWSLDPI